MSANVKRVLNRGGLVLVIVGIAGVTIGGGDTSAAIETAGTVASIAGTVLILLRELFN